MKLKSPESSRVVKTVCRMRKSPLFMVCPSGGVASSVPSAVCGVCGATCISKAAAVVAVAAAAVSAGATDGVFFTL